MEVDLNKIKRIYFVGIKGVAMTALAVLARERGFSVAGSDTTEDFPTSGTLTKKRIEILPNFAPAHILGRTRPDLVIYTGAHGGRDNPEVVEAIKQGIPALPQGQALGLFMADKRQISVAGSHGKTTTAAMIANILVYAGRDPSYAIGCGEIFGLGPAGHWGKRDIFIAEADEYATDPGHDPTPRFLWQQPEILVVTNIDFDHPDVYGSLNEVKSAFVKFTKSLPKTGELILGSDDGNSVPLAETAASVSLVGRSPRADYQVANIHFGVAQTFFRLSQRGVFIAEFTLKVPGVHNAVNAGMAAVAAHLAGVPWPGIREGLLAYAGTKRRFEKLAETGGVLFYDDYAHHPKEIKATLSAARAWYPERRIITVFQPHTYTRTQALLRDFAQAFTESDIVLLTDIYASAREKPIAGITGETLAQATVGSHANVFYVKDREGAARYLDKHTEPGDVVIFMGAGDIYRWGKEFVNELQITTDK